MRIWLEPATAITAGASLLGGVASVVGGMGQAAAGAAAAQRAQQQSQLQAQILQTQGERQAVFYENQIPGVQRDEWQAITDSTNESQSAKSLAVAVSVAQGGGLDTGIVNGIAGKYGMMESRIHQNAAEQQWLLETQADNSRMTSKEQASYALMGGTNQSANLISSSSAAGTAGILGGIGGIAKGAFGLYTEGKTLFN